MHLISKINHRMLDPNLRGTLARHGVSSIEPKLCFPLKGRLTSSWGNSVPRTMITWLPFITSCELCRASTLIPLQLIISPTSSTKLEFTIENRLNPRIRPNLRANQEKGILKICRIFRWTKVDKSKPVQNLVNSFCAL